MSEKLIEEIAKRIAPEHTELYLSTATEGDWHSDVLHLIDELTAERDQLREEVSGLKGLDMMNEQIITKLESQLAKADEALGAIMKIQKRGQAYDVAKQALADLKGEE